MTRFSGRTSETLADCHKIFSKDNTKGIIMLTQELALNEFYYLDGELYHKYDKNYRTKKGDVAGCINQGYRRVVSKGKCYLVHRVVFLMVHGRLPKYIDHKDHNSLNNNINNLRECTFSQNVCNQPKPSHNTSGEKGVYFDKSRNKWKVQMEYLGKQFHFGRYESFEKAKLVAIQKRKELHGNFANNN